VLFRIYTYKDNDYLISVLSVKFYTSTSIQGEEQAMEVAVSIDKFVIDYKDVPHSAFLRVYMVGLKKYQVKMEIYSGTYSYELHMRKSDDVYIHMYFKNFRETEGHLHTLRIETRPEHYSHFREILEMIGKRGSRVEFVSCDVAYDIQTGLENIVVIPIDARRNMTHFDTTRYFGRSDQRKRNGFCRISAKESSIPCILSTEAKRRQNKGTSISLYHETACKHYIRYDEAQNSL